MRTPAHCNLPRFTLMILSLGLGVSAGVSAQQGAIPLPTNQPLSGPPATTEQLQQFVDGAHSALQRETSKATSGDVEGAFSAHVDYAALENCALAAYTNIIMHKDGASADPMALGKIRVEGARWFQQNAYKWDENSPLNKSARIHLEMHLTQDQRISVIRSRRRYQCETAIYS